MAIKFYKKLSPETAIVLGNNVKLPLFKSIDKIVGYYATNNEAVQQEFTQMMREGRYGLSEISETEFHEQFVKKKENTTLSKPVWREELGKNPAGMVLSSDPMTLMEQGGNADAAAVKGCDAPGRPCGMRLENGPMQATSTQVLANESIGANLAKQEFKPPAGKRSRGNRKADQPQA